MPQNKAHAPLLVKGFVTGDWRKHDPKGLTVTNKQSIFELN